MADLSGLISCAQMPKLFFVDSQGQAFANVVATVCGAKERKILRLTGGCGDMSDADAQGFLELFIESFRGFQGAVLFGGTRMYNRDDAKSIRLGITELGPAIRKDNPEATVIGVIAKTEEMRLTDTLIIGDDMHSDFVTVVHPDQDVVLVVDLLGADSKLSNIRKMRYRDVVCKMNSFEQLATKYAADPEQLSPWDGEFLQCEALIDTLVNYSRFQSLLTVYNGGGTTLKEVVAHLSNSWPVMVVKDSGRVADDIAGDIQLRSTFSENLHIVEPEVASMRGVLEQISFLEPGEESGSSILPFRKGAVS